MSLLFDPIQSGIDSLLAPFTSTSTTTDSSDDVRPITTATATTTASSIVVITPSPSSSSETSTSSSVSTKSTAKSTTDKSTTSDSTSSSSRKASSTSSSQSSSSTLTQTTLSTSTISTSTSSTTDSSTSSSSTSLTTSTSTSTSTPVPIPSAPPAASANSNTAPPTSGSNISTAGIIVAIIFAVALVISILWLTIRFCPPIRNRIDAWTERRRDERSYREALDGPAVPAKDFEPSSAASERSAPRDKYFSFFALGRNPRIEQQEVVHHQYISPNSASTPRGHGLGLGRVSLLRNHSLLRKVGHDVPPHIPSSTTRTHFGSQVPVQMQKATSARVVEVKKKPLPMPTLAPTQERAMTGMGGASERSLQMPGMTRDRNSPLPRLYVDIPETGKIGDVTRGSQIGLAVTSKSPAPSSGLGYRV